MTALTRRSLVAGLALGAAAWSSRAFAQAQTAAAGAFKLDPLPYEPARNEPAIDAQTMEIHHGRHHAAYVSSLNQAASQHEELGRRPLHEILARLGDVPEAVRATVRNSGGGHANHTMFWQIMGGRGGEPGGELKSAIDRDLGGLAKMQEEFNAAGGRVFGSGWVFVTVDSSGKLALATKPNQDTPLMDGGRVLLGNDVWEHAYYLKYQNRRADYLKAWWSVVDWDRVAERYAAAKAGQLTI